jgi:hypothetical protein
MLPNQRIVADMLKVFAPFWTALVAFVVLLAITLESIFGNLFYSSLLAFLKEQYGIEESAMTAILVKNFIPFVCSVSLVYVVYHMSKIHHATRLNIALNDILNRTRLLTDNSSSLRTIEEYDAWKRSINENHAVIQNKLKGKISPAEINILLSGPGGPALIFRTHFGLEENNFLNYLHYLEIRIGDLIRKYS